MRPISVTVTGVGVSAPIPLDTYISPFNIGVGVEVGSGCTVAIQHTFDNIWDSSVTPVWFNHPTLVGLIANADGNYAFPVTAVRVNQSVGSASTTVKIIQAGMPGQ